MDSRLSEDEIARAVHTGMASWFKELIEDEETVEKFWKSGYHELVKHVGNDSSQWIGKRILTALAMAVLVAVLTWLLRTGALK